MTSAGILFKQIPGQVTVDDAQGIVECFVAGVGNKDSVGDIVAPGAFAASLRRRTPRVVWGHDWNQPIGKVLEIYEVPPSDNRLPKKMREAGIGGLFAKVQFNLKSERGREAFASVSFFGLDQEWSIGYKTLDAVYDNGRQANVLKEVELYEVSPVLHGANQLTGTISIKSDSAGMSEKASKKPLRDPEGGLTAAGREHFKRTEGANLKPGVKGPADTPTKMRRKGSFLTRFFSNPSGPMTDDKGRPTRLALSARAWGEPVPKNAADAAELAAKGRRLLERYANTKKKSLDEKGGSELPSHWESGGSIGDFQKRLMRAVADEMDAPVKFRTSDENMIVFDAVIDGQKMTFRMGYHSEDGEFMFGRAQRVRPETVYMPFDAGRPAMAFAGDDEKAASPCWPGYEMVGMKPGKDGKMVPNCVPVEGKADDISEDMGDDLDNWLPAMLEYADGDENDGEKVDGEALSTVAELFLATIETKAGRAISNSNVGKLNEAIRILREVLASGGSTDIEMKKTTPEFVIPAEKSELFSLREHLEPILDFYGAETECNDSGIFVKSLEGDDVAFEDAINTALSSFDIINKGH